MESSFTETTNNFNNTISNTSNQTNERTIKKNYSFERIIKVGKEKEEKEIVLSFNIILYEDEIIFNIKKLKDNLKSESASYKKNYSFEELKYTSNFFAFINGLEKIFDFFKKNFGNKKDIISLEKDKLTIKFNITLEVIEEEIVLNIPIEEKTETDEMNNIKETVIFLNEEKKNLKAEISKLKENENKLNNTVDKLKEEHDTLKKQFEEMSKYMKDILKPEEEEEKELQVYECIREKNFKQKDEEEEGNIIKENNTPQGKYISTNIFIIYLFLYKEKVKIKINEIQDNLKSNPLIYESIFVMNDFEKVSKYYIKYTDIKAIYDFLCDLFKNKKDTLDKKDDDKIILNVYFTCGLKEDNITLEILNKELSLTNTLKNIKQSIKIINKNAQKDNNQINNVINDIKNDIYKKMKTDIDDLQKQTYNLKIEFQKDLLEKVYPVGSYYWSQKNTSPEELFGGKWESISGRFLFSTDSNHSVDSTGGEERHTLTVNEMPSHTDQYDRFNYYSYAYIDNVSGGSYRCPIRYDDNFISHSNVVYTGGNQPHNNMPPYITAYCWRRYK